MKEAHCSRYQKNIRAEFVETSVTGVPPVQSFDSSLADWCFTKKPCLSGLAGQLDSRREVERWTGGTPVPLRLGGERGCPQFLSAPTVRIERSPGFTGKVPAEKD